MNSVLKINLNKNGICIESAIEYICNCGGQFIPLIRQKTYDSWGNCGSNPELVWRCTKCHVLLDLYN